MRRVSSFRAFNFGATALVAMGLSAFGLPAPAHYRPADSKIVDAAEFERHGVNIELVSTSAIEYHWEIHQRHHRVVKVREMSQFAGKVRISSSRAALRYVTLGDEDGLGAWIGPIEEQSIRHVPSLQPIEGAFGGDGMHASEGNVATVTDGAWSQLGLHEPRSRRVGRSWLVTRPVLINQRGTGPWRPLPFLITERVGFDGGYAITKELPLPFDKAKFHWTMCVVQIALPGA